MVTEFQILSAPLALEVSVIVPRFSQIARHPYFLFIQMYFFKENVLNLQVLIENLPPGFLKSETMSP